MLIPAPWPSWPPALGPQLPWPSAKRQGMVGRLQNRYLCPRIPLRWVIRGWWLPVRQDTAPAGKSSHTALLSPGSGMAVRLASAGLGG